MKRRTTENVNHIFQQILYKRIRAFDLQGLFMNKERDGFTAGIEYFDLDSKEYEIIKNSNMNPNSTVLYKQQFNGFFSRDQIFAQCELTQELHIPLYYLWGYEQDFWIHEIQHKKNKLHCKASQWKTENLIAFWGKFKQTKQTHPKNLNGAQERAAETHIDEILEQNNLEWGGNIDGFVIRDKRIVAIIDCISIGERSQSETHNLKDCKADPSLYFFKKGPKYESWLSTVTLAEKLKVPLLVITLDKVTPTKETIGLASIEYLSRNGISYYKHKKPNNNVINGLDDIASMIDKYIKQSVVPKIKK